MDMKIDTRTLATALAVNLGMRNISDLVMVERDTQLKETLKSLVKRKLITKTEAWFFKPFFNARDSPMDPLYCIVKPYEGTDKYTTPYSLVSDDTQHSTETPEKNVDDDILVAEEVSGFPTITIYMSLILDIVNCEAFNAGYGDSMGYNELIFEDLFAGAVGDNFNVETDANGAQILSAATSNAIFWDWQNPAVCDETTNSMEVFFFFDYNFFYYFYI